MVHGPITRNVSSRALGLIDIRVGNAAANIANIQPVLGPENSIGALKESTYNAKKEFFEQFSGFPKNLDGIIPLSSVSSIVGSYLELTPFNMALSDGIDPSASVPASATRDVQINSTDGTTDLTKVIAVTDGTPADWAPIDEEYTVVFTGATAGSIFGKKSGLVHTFVALNAAMAPVDGDTKKLFSIPAAFFTGTWAADETYVFYTTSGGASTYADPHVGSVNLGALVAPVGLRVEGVYTFPDGIKTMTFLFPMGKASGDVDLAFSDSDEAAPQITLSSTYAGSRSALGNAVWDSMPQGRIIWA